MLFTNSRNQFAKDPAVIRFDGKYYLYYTVLYDDKRIGVGIAVSEDMENWRELPDVPLTEAYENRGIGAPAAIVLGNTVHLFYQTYGHGRNDKLCHATSRDGVNFVKDPTNPIFSPTADWCSGRAIDADVCVFGDRLLLYFATRDHEMKIQKVGGAWAPIDSDFSKDTWTQMEKQALVAPELLWEGACIEAPATIVNNGKVFLFYGGSYNCTPQQIGCAVSDDGVFFRKLFVEEPFIPCGAEGDWNSSESGHPYAFRDDDGRAYLFYQGSADMGKTWYLTKCEFGFTADNIPYKIG